MARMRKISPWMGTTDDAKVPLHVQLRILERQGGKCALTGHKFRPGDGKQLDHIKALADGGQHSETNLQWILDASHTVKTAAEAKERAKVRARARAHAGIKTSPARPLQGRPFPESEKAAKRAPKLPTPSHMPTELERRYGIRAPTKGSK